MRLLIFNILAMIIPLSGVVLAQTGEPFKVGDLIPQFKLPYATKDTLVMDGIGSEALKGKRYLIAFFPAAWSSGCTKEMCTFRDAFSELQKLNVEILAVSGDYVFTLHEWAKNQNFGFMLLGDQTREFGKKMGVYNEKSGTLKRSVFLVGPDGKIQYINYNYSVTDDKDFTALKQYLAGK